MANNEMLVAPYEMAFGYPVTSDCVKHGNDLSYTGRDDICIVL